MNTLTTANLLAEPVLSGLGGKLDGGPAWGSGLVASPGPD
jgi:hypothetical protein